MGYSTLRYEVSERIGTITFATPDRMNSITEERMTDLEAVVSEIEKDDNLGVLILTGEGRAFCVGLDLGLLDQAFSDVGYFERSVRRLSKLVSRIDALPIPTIAAVNGFCRAGGFEIAMGCDFVILADEAKIGDVHSDAGVVPAFTSMRLKARIGEQKAKEVLFTGRWLTGKEAVDYGLAIRSFPRDQLIAGARAFAADLTNKPRAVLAHLKSVFQESRDATVEGGIELELKAFAHYMGTQPWGREGYRAFRENRLPSWKTASA